MAYETGSANSFADLLAALQAACTGNGWTLSGNVLHKGTCYAEVKLTQTQGSVVWPNSALGVRACNGIDGSNLPRFSGAPTKLYGAGADQPIFSSMAAVAIGTQEYVFEIGRAHV